MLSPKNALLLLLIADESVPLTGGDLFRIHDHFKFILHRQLSCHVSALQDALETAASPACCVVQTKTRRCIIAGILAPTLSICPSPLVSTESKFSNTFSTWFAHTSAEHPTPLRTVSANSAGLPSTGKPRPHTAGTEHAVRVYR